MSVLVDFGFELEHVDSRCEADRRDNDFIHISSLEWNRLLSLLGDERSSGILLHGESGSGKSHLIMLLLRRLSHKISIFRLNSADMLHKEVGESEKALRSLFEKVMTRKGAILIVEDIDILFPDQAIVQCGEIMAHFSCCCDISIIAALGSLSARLLSTFISCWDSTLVSQNCQYFAVVATARNSSRVRSELLRSGRLEDQSHLSPLDPLLAKSLVNKFCSENCVGITEQDELEIASLCSGKHIGSIMELLNNAILNAFRIDDNKNCANRSLALTASFFPKIM